MKTIGIIGGGQLGKMMVQAAKTLGFTVVVLDPYPNSPAGQVADREITGSLADPVKLRELVTQCDFTTYDIEHIETSELIRLADEGHIIRPDPRVLALTQDKLTQKQRLLDSGLAVPAFVKLESRDPQEFRQFGFPLVQKTRKGGYDGKGVMLMRSEADLAKVLPGDSMLERCVDIDLELAVMTVRGADGEVRSYPTVEMTFDSRCNALDTVIVPARISPELDAAAQKLARQCIDALGGVGIFGVEMFLDKQGRLSVNEVAPRPHNSGHYTIEACVTSQFEQHIRAVAGLPLGDCSQIRATVSMNLLGEPGFSGPPVVRGLEESLALPGVHFHLYGKPETRPLRKMGHVTVTAANLGEALRLADRVKAVLRIEA
ncbi:MAG: hypothetical protein RL095_2467 [Verrucomicrobiota bacterium]|jgi:5-(carboxyamino)imidazole ribonucleotide synthase